MCYETAKNHEVHKCIRCDIFLYFVAWPVFILAYAYFFLFQQEAYQWSCAQASPQKNLATLLCSVQYSSVTIACMWLQSRSEIDFFPWWCYSCWWGRSSELVFPERWRQHQQQQQQRRRPCKNSSSKGSGSVVWHQVFATAMWQSSPYCRALYSATNPPVFRRTHCPWSVRPGRSRHSRQRHWSVIYSLFVINDRKRKTNKKHTTN